MANFRTHIVVGTVATGLLATMTMAASVITPNQVVTLALAGAFGSVLPDIDLERSRSSRAIFFALALFLSFCVLFAIGWKYSILEMWLIWIGVFLGIRYIGQGLFHRFAVHRGIFHSLLAGVFFMFATAAVFYNVYDTTPAMAWLGGLFVLFGYAVHLALDEIYSVDFDNTRIKKSFGTALKLFEYRSTGASIAMLFAAVGVFYLTPAHETLIEIVATKETWQLIGQKLLPENSLFGIEVGEALERLAAAFDTPGAQSTPTGGEQSPTGSITASDKTEIPQ